VDWDGDGRLDIIVGDRPGNVHYFRRLDYGHIYLEEQELVTVAGRPIDVGYNSAPCVTDWNGDGLPDLVVGNLSPIPAGIFLFVNQGSPYSPNYLVADTVFFQGEPIEITTAYPDMHDMDSDGLQDLVVGSSSGMIACFVNGGTPQQPLFEEMEYLRADGEEIHITSYVRPTVCDWNADGTPDLLVGDYTGQILLFTGVPQSGMEPERPLSVRLLENPIHRTVSLLLELNGPEEAELALWSLDGRMIGAFQGIILHPGSNILQVPAGPLPPGVYFMRVSSGGRSSVLRFVSAD